MSNDDDDWANFGGDGDDGDGEVPCMIVGERSVNSIEHELKERLHIAELLAVSVDLPFIEDETDDAERTRAAAINEIAAIEAAPARETWLSRIAIAHELGPTGTKEQYEAMCKEMEIDPWPMT